MVFFEVHQRFKGHFLNELRVSFKDPSVVPILPILFVSATFSKMLIKCLLSVFDISYSSVMNFPQIKVMLLLEIVPLFFMKGLIKLQKPLLVSILFAEIS